MQIGSYTLPNALVLAPMAGVTDRPFRQMCRKLGAGMTVSEMVSSKPELWNTRKSQLRRDHRGEPEPVVVQIAGADPQMMADAARFNADNGADIIDINMGCPAKKVCNVMAGSALMRDELLVQQILEAVVNAVDIPVTLKMRTGWDPDNKNATEIARVAEETGIQALTIHGRTRQCRYNGEAEYDTIARIKCERSIPVIANGDIDSVEKAAQVLRETGVDAIMIGRAAQGRPWIFNQIQHYLQTGKKLHEPSPAEVCKILLEHLQNLHEFYGEYAAVRIARKHINWYCKSQGETSAFRKQVNQAESSLEQIQIITDFFEQKANKVAA